VSSRFVFAFIAAAAIAAFLAHALHHAFVQDDAYVFLRYSQNLLDGHGPVWNPGEPVEGYSSLVWMLGLALLLIPGVEVEPLIHAATLAAGLATLLVAFQLSRERTGSVVAGWFAVTCLLTDRTFAVWSTSGMETRLYGLLALAGAALALGARERPAARSGSLLGSCLALLCLTRPEGILLAGLALAFVRSRGAVVRSTVRLAAGICGTVIALQFAWRLSYYGRLLPNTFYVKVGGIEFADGARYLWDYATSFPLSTVAISIAVAANAARNERTAFELYLALVCATYAIYIAAIGGGFMEFRWVDVLLPIGYVSLAVLLARLWSRTTRHAAHAALALVLVAVPAGNLYFDRVFDNRPHRVLTREAMSVLTTDRWVVVGKWFAEIAEPGESLATTAAGAIPYYSRLPSVDMLGLNDAFVAGLADQPGRRIGHRKSAPHEYLVERGITFVLGEPRISSTPRFDTSGPDRLVVRVPNSDPAVLNGRDFYLQLSTTGDRLDLVRSLRRRGVEVSL
jgi:arabinofuranosyltransferase